MATLAIAYAILMDSPTSLIMSLSLAMAIIHLGSDLNHKCTLFYAIGNGKNL
jgi:hypothetical protein